MSESMIPVVLTVSDEHLDRMTEVLAAAGGAGFVAGQVLADLGTAVGSVPQGSLDRVAAVRGVSSVQRRRVVADDQSQSRDVR